MAGGRRKRSRLFEGGVLLVAEMGKQGWVEWALVTAFLALAAAGAVAVFGDEIREALGVRPGARPSAARLPARAPAR
jgi:hypothetical protein